MDKQELLNAVNLITEFLDTRPGGESYWVDDEGQNHDADIGYVNEFLDDLKLYLEGKRSSPEVDLKSKFNYFVLRPL